MSDAPTIADLFRDQDFPEVDIALRRGCHIDEDADRDQHLFIERYQVALQAFYRAYDADLMRDPDGYWALVPLSSSPFRIRHLHRAEMVVGLALAHLRMDPAILASQMTVSEEQLLTNIDALFGGQERLQTLLGRGRGPKRTIHGQQKIRKIVRKAVTSLARLGFLERQGERLLLRPALGRFVDIARDPDPSVALNRLKERCRAIAGSSEDGRVPDTMADGNFEDEEDAS